MGKLFNALGLIVCIPLTGFANPSCDFFSGFYLGGGLGVETLGSDQRLSFNPAKVNNVSNFNLKYSYGQTRVQRTGFLGYGKRLNDWAYAALEGIIASATPAVTNLTTNISYNSKQDTSYGGRLKLGYAEEPWLVYGLAGILRANVNQRATFVNGGTYQSDTMFLQTISTQRNAPVYQLGGGLDYAYNRHWAVRLEYAHSFFNAKNHGLNHSITTFNNPIGNYHSSLHSDELFLGIRYRWC